MKDRMTRFNWELIAVILLCFTVWGGVFFGGVYVGWKMKEKDGTVRWTFEECK